MSTINRNIREEGVLANAQADQGLKVLALSFPQIFVPSAGPATHFFAYPSGASEPNPQECAFVHPLFRAQANKMKVLRIQNLGLSYNLRTQY